MTSPADARAAAVAEQERRGQRAEELLRQFVMAEFRDEYGSHHLAVCPGAQVTDCAGRDGAYGCETGCSYYTLTATILCEHSFMEYSYGSFGEISDMITWLEQQEHGKETSC